MTCPEIRVFDRLPQVSQRQTHNMRFTGSDKVFRKMVLNGTLLEIVTFGFYRFRLATDMRRYLWSHTMLDDDAFVYSGAAMELLIGFLLSTAVLALVNLAFNILGADTDRQETLGGLLTFLFFSEFIHFALYRARRYRLNRTSWRGVRFGMEGSGVSYALRVMGWDILVIFTFGLVLPWRLAGLERYKMRNSFYGDLRGNFVATGGALFRNGWTLWLGSIAIVVGYFYSMPVMWSYYPKGIFLWIYGSSFVLGGILSPKVTLLIWCSAPLPLFLPPAIYVYGRYNSILWKWWVEGVRIGPVCATSSLGNYGLVGNYFVFAGLVVPMAIVFGLVIPTAILLGFVIRGYSILNLMEIPLDFSILSTFAMIVIFIFLRRIYLIQRIWKIVVNSLAIHNLATAEEVAMRPEAHRPGALDEGFIGNLDIGGF